MRNQIKEIRNGFIITRRLKAVFLLLNCLLYLFIINIKINKYFCLITKNQLIFSCIIRYLSPSPQYNFVSCIGRTHVINWHFANVHLQVRITAPTV